MPDFGARLGILKATFKKAPLAEGVDLEYLATVLDGYTGADISEVCQHAAKIAIKQVAGWVWAGVWVGALPSPMRATHPSCMYI